MKKLFSVILCLTMILSLAACGAGGNAETAPSAQQGRSGGLGKRRGDGGMGPHETG